MSVALCFLQQATNLVLSSGESSRSRSSVRKLDSLTLFPVQADAPRVHETGKIFSKSIRQTCDKDGRKLIRLSIAGVMTAVEEISIDSRPLYMVLSVLRAITRAR